MQHAARHLCATVLQDGVQKRGGRRGGGSRDILVSSLVPVNSLTTQLRSSLWQSD